MPRGKKADKSEPMADTPEPTLETGEVDGTSDVPAESLSAAPPNPASPSPPPSVPPSQVRIDDSSAIAMYSNFCRVTGTPEELIIDFGLNPQPYGPITEAIRASQRIIVNFYTAKRMLAALQMTIQRYEGAFGAIETNVENRVLARGISGV